MLNVFLLAAMFTTVDPASSPKEREVPCWAIKSFIVSHGFRAAMERAREKYSQDKIDRTLKRCNIPVKEF